MQPDRTLAEPVARRRGAILAGHRQDTAAARAMLDDTDAGVRASTLRALARAGALQAADLRRGAADGAATVRRATAELIGRHRGPDDDADLAGALSQLLSDRDARVVEMAAWAAGESTTGRSCLTGLIGLAGDHDDPLVREAAVASLGARGDARGLPAILAATQDRATVRRRAVLALAPFDGPEVERALARAREDRDWQVRQAAEDLS
jgi:HEAT repeat protein